MTYLARLACLSLLGSVLPTAAFAQAVDYATLQDTIGEPVTTSVTGRPQRASETPASIEIITRDQIAHSPALDVPGLLKTYAGVDVNRWTAGQTDVSVRGGVQTYNPRLLVLVNGRQVYLDHYGMTDWNLLGVQLEEIQQIELVRGPATALFGFNAASAVVNIITTDALGKRAFDVAGEVGTHGHQRLSAVAIVPLGEDAGLRVSGGHQRDDERAFPDYLAQPATRNSVKRDEIAGTLEATPDAKTRVTLNGGYSRNDQLELLPTQVATMQRFEAVTAGARVDRDTLWGSLTGRVYANWLNADYGVGQNGGVNLDPGDLKNRIVVAQGSSLVRLGLNSVLRIGVEYRNNRLDGMSLFSPRIDYTVWSANGMLDLHPSDRVALTFAGRIDRLALRQDGAPLLPSADVPSAFDRDFVRPSFNAAALFQVGTAGQFRINGGLGYQIPSLIDFGIRLPLIFPGLPLVLLAGSPQLDPVSIWSAEAGYSQPLSGTVKADITLFYNRTANAIASPGGMPNFSPSTIGGLTYVTRLAADGDFRTFGVELSVDGVIGQHITWRGNYTLTDTDQALQPVETLAFSPRATTPRNIVNVELGYNRGPWFATAVVRYTSGTWQFGISPLGAIGLFPVKSAIAWDQKIGVTFGKATFSVIGENLTAAGGASGSLIPADRRVLAGVRLAL
jgi:iron complex outermembrane receptor protein